MKARLLLAAAPAAALLALAGCGGGGSSSSDLASLAPPESLLYVEGTLRPTGSLKSNVDAIAQSVGGVDNLGDFIVEQLESSAKDDGEPLDFEREIDPWLGEKAAVFFEGFDGSNFTDYGAIVETTDAAATESFIDKRAAKSKYPEKDGSYEGFEYKTDTHDYKPVVGIVGDYLVVAEDIDAFENAVDASEGEALADEDRFASLFSEAAEGSLADAYVDVGALVEPSSEVVERRGLDPQVLQALRGAGIDPGEATAVASLVPGADQVEIEVSSDLGGEEPPRGDAADLLGSLPATSFAAFAVSGFGEQVQEAIDSVDASGVPETIPPHQLKKGLKQLGIDLEGIAASLEEAGAFAVGNSERSLAGALVLTTTNSKAMDSVANIGKLLRSVQVAGVTALSGKANGFTVRNDELGDKPLVVAAKDRRLAIGYGVPATLTALAAESGRTLSDTPAYKEAVSALGSTPIAGFAAGPAALRLADALVPSSEQGFQKAKRYLKAIRFVALGSAGEGDLATAKLIVGLEK
jgi:Protein of unknown function (DUF3352)